MILSGWGAWPRQDCRLSRPREPEDVAALLAEGRAIARGNGRSYGDSALSHSNTLDMRGFSRLLGFDEATGRIEAEAGVMLDDLLKVFLPRGWFPWVTPGTRFVTLGGMIASDVHGKNHHLHGSFGEWLDWIELMGADGHVLRCSHEDYPDLFYETIGGMGLTGVILRAGFRFRRVETAWIRQRDIGTRDLAETLEVFEAEAATTYSVAWIDCLAQGAALGRSIVSLGEHAARIHLPLDRRDAPFAAPVRRKLSVPFHAPDFALNRYSVRAFNHLHYGKGRKASGETIVGWDGYFYPLDALLNWNRIYGKRGFAQYQCVLPLAASAAGLRELLLEISKAGLGSFLAVLKRMGPAGRGRLSFPMEGHTLALDFPASPQTMALLRRLDEIVLAHGGRFYLAKDSRLTPETLRRADPRVEAFHAMRRQGDLNLRFSSSQSERLYL